LWSEKNLDCLKRYLPHRSEGALLARTKSIYGDINPATDNDLIYITSFPSVSDGNGNFSYGFYHAEKYLKAYKDIKEKLSLKELHRMSMVDNLSRFFKLFPLSEYVCRDKKNTQSISYYFYNGGYERVSFFKDKDGSFKFGVSTNPPSLMDTQFK
jgi:hypothetical protein